MNHFNAATKIKDYIAQISDIDKSEITNETPLLEYNILDSVSIFSLLTFISTELRVEIPLEKVKAESFATIDAICSLIEECNALIEDYA